jgi:hypothetical protein
MTEKSEIVSDSLLTQPATPDTIHTMKNPQFNDEYDNMNDEGYDIQEEWLREEEEYWSEDTLDPADSGEYDPVSESDNSEATDEWSDEDMDETPIGLEYDTYNDADNY